MREYIARDPKTGKPLRTGRKRSHGLELAYKPGEGAWDALPLDRILPLATGDTDIESVIWRDKERLLRRTDAFEHCRESEVKISNSPTEHLNPHWVI
ncbi:MAG: hypothetical protein Ct9H90mP16_17930 [Candidatus Poseidoniales archaeon]|nr:MAG: hypothetical protein Ct9H90mP16_17930 [Candidatus Poseidoniales archaeon]